MKALLFIFVFCSVLLAPVPLHADEPSVKISLGIRHPRSSRPAITNVTYPLAFRIENTGKTVMTIDQARELFFSGVIHFLSKDGKEEYADLRRFQWSESFGLVPNDLGSGDIFENKIVVNLLQIFHLIKDGDYQVWWILRGSKSNVLHFTVTDGKLHLINESPVRR